MTEQGLAVVRAGEGEQVQVGDVSMDLVVPARATESGIAVQVWTLGPRKLSAPPHRHEREDEIFYILEGEVTIWQDGIVERAQTGELVVLPRGRFHTFWNAGNETARLLVMIAPGKLESYFKGASDLIRPDAPPDLERLGQLVQQYGVTIQFERIGQLIAEHGLESDIPIPHRGSPSQAQQEG